MRYGHVALLVLLAAATPARAVDPDTPLEEMTAEQLGAEQERVEDRWLLLQQRRFEAVQRGDERVARQAERKFEATGRQRQTVLHEIARRASEE